MRSLLDINVLIAIHDRDHVHHLQASHWLEQHIGEGWATCPLTQNGCLRIMSQPAYASPQSIPVLMAMLHRSTSTKFHETWSDDLSLLDERYFRRDHIHGHRQLTDLYLLGLAVRHQGRLVSFDQRIPLSAVIGATQKNLVTLL
jgi:uncharacterized protein